MLLYDQKDPRDLPAYTYADAALYLKLPRSTLRDWLGPNGVIRPVNPNYLSFNNLVEGHALVALRRVHGLKLARIRSAMQYVAEKMGVEHPLRNGLFVTDGVDLFVERGGLVSASRQGQVPIKDVLRTYLRRVEWDALHAPIRLFPFTRATETDDAPKRVVIDPGLAFGRPAVSGIPTDVLKGRFSAGESPLEIAEDYQIAEDDVLEALRWEGRRAA